MTRTKRQKALRAAANQRRTGGPSPSDPTCPTPAKRKLTPEAAISVALNASKRTGRPWRVYECPCGAHHLTRKPARTAGQ